MPLPINIVKNPLFHQQPLEARRRALIEADPGEFGRMAPAIQLANLNALASQYGSAPVSDIGHRTATPPESKGFLDTLKTGVKIGVSDLAQSVSSAAGALAPSSGVAEVAREVAQDFAPTAEDMQGTDGILRQVLLGVGAAPAAALKYAPTLVAGKYAPLVAGAIGAASNAEKGSDAALKAGFKDVLSFVAQGKAAALPGRALRVAGGAAAGAVPELLDGGTAQDAVTAALMGGAFSAIGGRQGENVALDESIKRAEGAWATNPARKAVLKFLAPDLIDESGAQAARSGRAVFAEQARAADQASHALKEARQYFNDVTPERRLDFIYAVQTGQTTSTKTQMTPDDLAALRKSRMTPKVGPDGEPLPDLPGLDGDGGKFRVVNLSPQEEEFAKTLREVANKQRDAVIRESTIFNKDGDPETKALGSVQQKLDAAKFDENILNDPEYKFYENYFANMWENPDEAKKFMSKWDYVGKKPLSGPKGFLKQRHYPTILDGIEAGLKPISDNPVDLLLLKHHEMGRYLTGLRWVNELADQGIAKQIKSNAPVPEGFKAIADPAFTINVKNEDGAIVPVRRWVLPEAAAGVVENYLSPGLRGNKTVGPAVRGMMAVNNAVNLSQLGMGAFHLGMTSLDATMSNFAVGVMRLVDGVKRGDGKMIASAGNVMLKTPIAAFEGLGMGNKIWNEWHKEGSAKDPFIADLVSAAKEAGARVEMPEVYRTLFREKMIKAWRADEKTKAALNFMGAIPERMSELIMEKIVPRQKMAVFARMAQFEMDRLPQVVSAGADTITLGGRTFNRDQFRKAVGRAWDSTDNRMGQLVYDNVFWNKIAKDAAMLTVRTVGWNLGTFREILGGIVDTGAYAAALISRNKQAEFTHRMSYLVAMPVVALTVGSALNYLMTGKAPGADAAGDLPSPGDHKGLWEYAKRTASEAAFDGFFPRTGQVDINGRPERFSLPSYIKDIVEWFKDPKHTALNKVASIYGIAGQMLENRDFWGSEIANENDPMVQRVFDYSKHLGKSLLPFSASTIVRQREKAKYRRPAEGAVDVARDAVTDYGSLLGVVPMPKVVDKTPLDLYIDVKTKDRQTGVGRDKGQDRVREITSEIQAAVRNRAPIPDEALQAIASGQVTKRQADSAVKKANTPSLINRVSNFGFFDITEAMEIASPEERKVIAPVFMNKLKTSLPQQLALAETDYEREALKERLRKIVESLRQPPE